MSGFVSVMLSIGVLVSALLIGAGATILIRKQGDRRRGWLMLGAGLVTLINIYLYATMPVLPPQP